MAVTGLFFTEMVTSIELTHLTFYAYYIKYIKTVLSFVGETGASCYRGRLLQGRFMQKCHIDGEIAYSSCIRNHQVNH